MEYKKETENFSFGFGTEKIAVKGKLSETEIKKAGFAETAVPLALTAGAGLLRLLLRLRRKKK